MKRKQDSFSVPDLVEQKHKVISQILDSKKKFNLINYFTVH